VIQKKNIKRAKSKKKVWTKKERKIIVKGKRREEKRSK